MTDDEKHNQVESTLEQVRDGSCTVTEALSFLAASDDENAAEEAKELRRMRRNANRRAMDNARRSCGLTKTRYGWE